MNRWLENLALALQQRQNDSTADASGRATAAATAAAAADATGAAVDTDTDADEDEFVAVLRRGKERVERKWATPAKNTAKLSDFELVRTLGSGTFGRVMLARLIKGATKAAPRPSTVAATLTAKAEATAAASGLHRRPTQYYAMKIMTKRKVMRTNHVPHAINERKILSAVRFPFLVSYAHHFKDNANLYLVMEYVAGGDMFTHLKKRRKFDEPLAKFYAAQVALAFQYLHYVGIVFRDLKPENIMIDKGGFIKLTDFGFAKKIDSRKTDTQCGTPEYYAPEMVKNHSYSYSVDWWTLGVLIYEMSDGKPPFRSSNVLKLFQLILDNEIEYPATFSANLKSVISNLMRTERTKRLASAKAVKAHKFFDKLDWWSLYKRKTTPPFVPEVFSDSDTHNFERHPEEKIEEFPEVMYAKEFEDY